MPLSFWSKNSFMNRWTDAPIGYSAKYRTYSANVNKANAALNERCVNAGYIGTPEECLTSVRVKVKSEETQRTSTATPGRNITTASPWKNFLRALMLNVGTRLSAASSHSFATFALGKFGKLGKLGKLGKFDRLGRFERFGRFERLGRFERFGKLGKLDRLGRFGILDKFGRVARFESSDKLGKFEKLMPSGPGLAMGSTAGGVVGALCT